MKRLSQEMYEEHNVSRLGLISIMKTIPESFRDRWSEHTVINGVPGQISCYTAETAGGNLGVPHGWDNDVVSAVHTLYVANGCPPEGTVTTTASTLLRMIGASLNREYYARLIESISRLHNTHYELTEHWFNAKRSAYSAARFLQFSDVQFVVEPHPFLQNETQTIITITLNRWIKENIESDHLIRLNPGILQPLTSSTARAFYRLIETMRSPSGYRHGPNDTLHVDLEVLRSRARILSEDPRPSRTKRIFDPILGQLKSLHYLKAVEEIKIDRSSGYKLTFSNAVEVIDSVAVEMLVQEGVSPGQARVLAKTTNREKVKEVISYVRDRHEQGAVRNVPGLINTLLTGENATYTPTPRPKKTSTSPAATTPAHPQTAAQNPDDALDEDSTVPSKTRNALMLLKIISARLSLSDEDQAVLQAALFDGHLDLIDFNPLATSNDIKDLLTLARKRTAGGHPTH